MSDRHSNEPRAPQDDSHKPVHGVARHHGHAVHLNRDQPEDLASKIMQAGSDYIASKTAARFSEEEVAQGISAVAAGPDPKHLANKIMKEAARELVRQEGTVTAGGVASMAQKVAYHRNDPSGSTPEHEVAEKIRERIAAAEEHADHHTFQGPNPEKGKDANAKLRHHRTVGTPYVTGGFRDERNPDVSEPRQ